MTILPRISRFRKLLLVLACSILASGKVLAAADSVLVFNEIQYHPRTAGETEWIELHSLQGVNVDISGWRIEGGVDFTFPNGTIVPGHGFLVVAATPGALPGVGAMGPWTGQLDNGGEELRLMNNSGRVMDRVSYGDSGEWPVGADGSGASLVKADEESADSGPSHWTVSPAVGGSPKAKNFPAATDVPAVTTLVPLNASWKYRDDNTAQAAGWNGAAFDDSAWSSGGALLYAGSPNITGAGEGLQGYWAFEETSGMTAANAATGGTDATLFGGMSFVADPTRGRVLNASGTGGSYASAGTLPQMTLTNDFTWSFWADSATSGGSAVVLGNRYNPSGVEWNPQEFTKFTPSSFEFYRSGAQEGVAYSGGVFPTNSWVHHAVVKQGGTMTYYRNGVAGGTRTITAGQNNAQPFYFGGDKAGENWNGKLDDVAVWTNALPASSIVSLANGSATPLTAPTRAAASTLTTQLAQGPATHYFRKSFNYNGAKERTTLALQHMLDDGAVIYLNGTEVLRVNMPAGPVSHETTASSNVTATSVSGSISIPTAALVTGSNVLAVEVHQFSTSSPNNDMVFGASLVATETAAPLRHPGTGFIFNEITAATDPAFQMELLNGSSAAVDLAGYQIRSSSGATVTLGAQTVNAGGYAVLTAAQLGFTPVAGDKLFLLQPGGTQFEDAQEVTNRLRGRAPGKGWLFPSAGSFGNANTFSINADIVINEIMYHPHPHQTSQEQWIELTNRGTGSVNLAGWKLSEGVDFTFPANATLSPGQYLVIASDPAAFAQNHAGLTALGPFTGSLAGAGERVVLEDASGNPVDGLRYFDGGRWADFADGGGSSLERRDLRADSTSPETWAASDESSRAAWQTVSYSGSGANVSNDPTQWNEFIFGLLAKGSFLIDDISVKETNAPQGISNRELIQNSDFSSGSNFWRLLGTHRHASVVSDGGNQVLRINASGFTEHMHNHAETTFKSGGTYVAINPASTYAISFRARWLGGNNLLNSRLYFNRLARTTALPVSPAGGTPGAVNSRAVANMGPTYKGLTHSPAVPASGQTATVSVRPDDPNGLGTLSLFYSVNGGAFSTAAMSDADADGVWTGVVPAQGAGAKVQFYVQGTDTVGATAFAPAAGPSSRAIIPWKDGLAGSGPAANFRITMLTADSNFMHTVTQAMSDDELGATVIYQESEIYYDVGVRLKGSERGRSDDSRVGWHLRFAPHDPFLGAHETVAIDRSGAGSQFSQKEILVTHALNRAGNIPGSYEDLVRVIAPRTTHTGAAMLLKARHSDVLLDNQWENGGDSPLYEYELIYYPTSTNTGGVEGLKLPQPDNVAGVPVTSLGTNKELYRWHYLQKNNRQTDDYGDTNRGLIAAVTAMGLPAGAQFYANTRARIDVDQWLRAFAIQQLFGIGDSYGTGGGQHNAVFYVRPTDGRLLYFPKDMDFTFSNAATSPIAAGDLDKLISGDPANRRAYYGHLLDIISRSFNSGYMSTWAQHYTSFLGGENLTAHMSYIDQRVASVQSQITAAIPSVGFAITTNGAQPITVGSPFATIAGRGWVNVREIRVAGSSQPLPVTWTGSSTWQVSVPVATGTQTVTLEAIGFNGTVLGTASITVTNTATTDWPALRINEWMADNASLLDPADNDAEDWIEVYNPTSAAVSLQSWQIADSSTNYTIPAGYSVPAGGFLLIWADDETVQNTGTGQLHAPFNLRAAGESLTLRAPDGTLVDTVTFGLQELDMSDGRYLDGASTQHRLTYPSPLARNILTTSAVTRSGATVTLTFTATPGVRYQPLVSDDLLTWVPLGGVLTATADTISVQDDVGTATKRFYSIEVDP
jgi:hypothetical protein